MAIRRLPNGAIPLPASLDETDDQIKSDLDEHPDTLLWIRISVKETEPHVVLGAESYMVNDGDKAASALLFAHAWLKEMAAQALIEQGKEALDHQGQKMSTH